MSDENNLELSFKKEQATKYKKGLEESLWAKWARIANKVLKEKIAEGIAILEAEIMAIHAANASFSDKVIEGLSFSQMQEHEELRLAEVTGASDDYQLVIPIGTTYDDWYGEIILTHTLMQAMVDNQKVLKNTKPFLNEGHDRGKALGWANGLKVTDEGLEVKWGFTKLGRSLIEDDIYKYYSGEILHAIDSETGEKVYPVFGGAALTNSPVMKGMPEAHLSDGNINKAEGPKDEGEENMDFSKLKEEAVNLSDSEKLELAKAVGFVNRDDEVIALADKVTAMTDVNSNLTEQNKALSNKLDVIDAEKIEKFLDTKITEGKLKPADKDVWKERLTKDFADYSEIMGKLPKIIDTDGPKGTGQDKEDTGKDYEGMAKEYSGKKPKKEEKK